MRMLSLPLLLLIAALPAAAQQVLPFDAGHSLVGGTARFERSSGDLYDELAAEQRRIAVNVRAQHFWLPGLALGADVMLDRNDTERFDETTFGVGPSASYFVGDSTSTTYPFASVSGLFIGRLFNDQVNGETESLRYYGGGVHASGGLAYRLGAHVAATVEVLFAFELAAREGSTTYDSRTGLGVRLGLLAFLF